MIFHAFQREDDDAVFTVVRNVSGGAFAVGESCVWDVASPDGVRVSQAASATLSLFRGVFAEAVADSGYGKVQVSGYCSTAKVSNNAATAIAAGNVLKVSTAAKHLIYSGAGDGTNGFVYAAEAYASSTNAAALGTKKVLLRAL